MSQESEDLLIRFKILLNQVNALPASEAALARTQISKALKESFTRKVNEPDNPGGGSAAPSAIEPKEIDALLGRDFH